MRTSWFRFPVVVTVLAVAGIVLGGLGCPGQIEIKNEPALLINAAPGAAGSGQAIVTWNMKTDLILVGGYVVKRSATETGSYTEVGGGLATSTAFTDTGLTEGQTYYYTVGAIKLGETAPFLTAGPVAVPVLAGDHEAPAVPKGLRIVNLDGAVRVFWAPVTNEDLAGYKIYKSVVSATTGYTEIASLTKAQATVVADSETRPEWKGAIGLAYYTVTGLSNGATVYFGVSSFDAKGNESDLDENILSCDATPRYEGANVTIKEIDVDDTQAGWLFSDMGAEGDPLSVKQCVKVDMSAGPEDTATAWDLFYDVKRNVVMAYGSVATINIRTLQLYKNTVIQDMGWTDHMSGVDIMRKAPVAWAQNSAATANPASAGYTGYWVEALQGHMYFVWDASGNFAKIWLKNVTDDEIVMDWAWQPNVYNPALAPKLQ